MSGESVELGVGTSELSADDETPSASDEASAVYIYLLFYVAPSLLCLISVVGIIGNSFVIYVITSTPHMRSSATNILLLNLAVADLYFLTVCAPFMAYKYATVSWTFGDLACKFVGLTTYTSSYVTVYTLVAISALRCVSFFDCFSFSSIKTFRVFVMVFVVLLVLESVIVCFICRFLK